MISNGKERLLGYREEGGGSSGSEGDFHTRPFDAVISEISHKDPAPHAGTPASQFPAVACLPQLPSAHTFNPPPLIGLGE